MPSSSSSFQIPTFVSLVHLKVFLDYYVNYLDSFLDPSTLELVQLFYKDLMSFEAFYNRSDGSARKRMEDWLHTVMPLIHILNQGLSSHHREWREKVRNGEDDGGGDVHLWEEMDESMRTISMALKIIQEDEYAFLQGEGSGVGRSDDLAGLSEQYNPLKTFIVTSPFVISLCGAAGIGKTTLARSIFHDLDFVEMFDTRAWVSVGRICRIDEILREILFQVDGDGICGMVEVGESLRGSLEGRRYLIVLDDVWDVDFWSELEPYFPRDDNRRSKVLLTTRSCEVARRSGAVTEMRLLNKEESWELLREKVFGGEECPPHLSKFGKKIAEHCDGLPLTIVAVSDLLSEAERTPEYWSEVASTSKHQLFADAYDKILEVLYPSYWNLPLELRNYFLSMGVFPQNLEISRSKLINLWVAEYDLLDPIESMEIEVLKSFIETPQHLFGPEVYAAVYLEELAINYLVTVYQRSTRTAVIKPFYSQGIKTCGLHSSWWHLCHVEAANTKVFYIINSLKDALEEEINGQTTLSIHNNVLLSVKEVYESVVESCASSARSLLCFGPYHQYPVPICYDLRLLQRLDALNVLFYEFPFEVTELVQLRYLALTCNEEVPPSICKLWKLQFLIVHQRLLVKCSGSGISYLPKEIWDLQELRHLEVMGSDLPSGNCLPYLSELLHVSIHSCTDVVFVGLPNLIKLGIQIELAPDGDGCSTYLDHVSYLEKLESLKCVVVNPEFELEIVRPPSLSILPSSLKKLSLNGLGCPWVEMSKIDALENLEVLKLQCNAFRSPEWDLRKFRFKKLEHLQIEDCDMEKLVVGSESLMKLVYLSIKHCYTLEEFCWESDLFVRNIELVDCNPLLEKQVKKIMRRGTTTKMHIDNTSTTTVPCFCCCCIPKKCCRFKNCCLFNDRVRS